MLLLTPCPVLPLTKFGHVYFSLVFLCLLCFPGKQSRQMKLDKWKTSSGKLGIIFGNLLWFLFFVICLCATPITHIQWIWCSGCWIGVLWYSASHFLRGRVWQPHLPFSCYSVVAICYSVCLCSLRPSPSCSGMGVCPHTGRFPPHWIKAGLAFERDLLCVLLYDCQYHFWFNAFHVIKLRNSLSPALFLCYVWAT